MLRIAAQDTIAAAIKYINKGIAHAKFDRSNLKLAKELGISSDELLKSCKQGFNIKDLKTISLWQVKPEQYLEMQKLGLGANEVANANNLGVSAEKLLDLKKLAVETKEKTVKTLDELKQMISQADRGRYKVKSYIENRGTTHLDGHTGKYTFPISNIKTGHYFPTMVDEAGVMTKVLSNGVTVKIYPQKDGSRIRKVFNLRGKCVYNDTIKTFVKKDGNTTYRVKDKVLNTSYDNNDFHEFSRIKSQELTNYHEKTTRVYNNGNLTETRLNVDGGHEVLEAFRRTGRLENLGNTIEHDLKSIEFIRYPDGSFSNGYKYDLINEPSSRYYWNM